MARFRSMAAVAVAASVVAAGLVVPSLPEEAVAAPPGADDDVSVPGRDLTVDGAEPSTAEDSTVVTSVDVPQLVWPGAGLATVQVPVPVGRLRPGEAASPPVSGVSVLADGAAASVLRPGSREWDRRGPGEVDLAADPPQLVGGLSAGGLSQVRVVAGSQQAASRAGGVQVFYLERTDGSAQGSAADVRVDYSGYAQAFGGNYADRLRLVRLPGCVLTSPELPACSAVPEPVEAVNNPAAGTLTARVPVSGDLSADRQLAALTGESTGPDEVLVVTSSGQGASMGDYEASDLNPDGTWQVGLSSGAFTYSYPVPEPPLMTGSGLDLALSYNSQSIDAFNQTTNNQAGWVGLGWNLSPGYIERKFRPCSEDIGDGSPKERADQKYWGTLCWESPDENDGEGDTTDYSTSELYLSLNGKSTRIVKDRVSGQWMTEDDYGWEIDLIAGGSHKEYWVISTLDGTRYRLGYTDYSNWWVPTVSDDPGEPDYANYPTSYRQTWRWNLDRVLDRNENWITLNWAEESNYYKRYLSGNILSYDRGGFLESVEYGYNHTVTGSHPTGTIDFVSMGRCVEATVEDDPVANPYPSDVCPSVNEANAASYPDVPVDLICGSSSCDQYSPSFFSTKRLERLTTYKWDAAAQTYYNIHRLHLRFKTLNPPGLTGRVLWLDRIFPIGHIGSDTNKQRLPGVNFDVQYLSGRVDYDEVEYGVSEQILPRVYRVYNGYGGRTDVTYGHVAPCPTGGSGSGNTEYWNWYNSKVGNWDINTDECAPVWHKPEDAPAGWGQFHKYLALKVVDYDRVGGSPAVVREYEYRGAAAWALGYGFIDSTGATESWNEWRGYPTVRVHTGSGTDPDDYSMVETTFFRGLYYDYYDDWSTQRHTKITNYDGGTYSDLPGKAGKPLQTRRYQTTAYAADPSARSFTEVSSSRFSYRWTGGADGPGYRNPRDSQHYYQRNRVKLADGTWREDSEQITAFDAYRLPTEIKEFNQVGLADDTCTTITYAQRDESTPGSHYNINLPETVETWGDDVCGTAPLVSKTVTLYDGASTVGSQNPYDGNPTQVRTYTTPTSYASTRASFDNYGRTTSTTDQLGRVTTISYNPAANWPIDGVTTTNPAGHAATIWPSASHGQPFRVVDVDGKQTDVVYDSLGRPEHVYLPGEAKTDGIPSAKFEYTYTWNGTTGQPSAATRVATHTLSSKTSGGQYLTSYGFDDGFGRLRETQTASPAGGQIVAATYYDVRGMAEAVSDGFHNTGTPGAGLANPAPSSLPAWTHTDYDTLGRATVTAHMAEGVELWRSSTDYFGDHTTTTPPDGAAPVTVWSDVNGNTALRQEHLPDGSTVDIAYTYDLKQQLVAVVDDAGNTWTYDYDLAGRRIETTDPDAGTTTMVYDAAGRLTSTTDIRGKTVSNTYDVLGRQTTRWDGPAGTGTLLAEWVYDTVQAGQLTSTTRWHGGQPYTATITGYTDQYQPTGTTVSIPTAEGVLAGDYTYTYSYTDVGRPETVTLPAAGGMPAETLTTSYTPLGQVDRLTSDYGGGTTYVDATTYDKTGDLVQQLLGTTGAKVARGLAWNEATGRLDGITTTTGVDTATPATVQDDTYTYDPAGNITTITDNTNGQAQCFTYDTLRRLVEAWTTTSTGCATAPSTGIVDGPDPYWHTWTFDTLGNRLTQVEHPTATGGGLTTTTYTYPAAGQPQPHTLAQQSITDSTGTVVQSYGYDQAGNTTSRPGPNGQQTLTWTAEGRVDTVTDATGTTNYVYTVEGDRLITHHGDGTATLYLPEGVEVHADSEGATTCNRYYGDIALRTNQGLSWLAADHHGTAAHAIDAATLDATTRRSDPYGNPRGPATGGTWPDDKTFLGATQDPTGLVHLGAREYDPGIGRFVSLDPVMNLANPQQIHGYTYANNNPTTWSDPSGLMCNTCWLPDGMAIPTNSSSSGSSSGGSGGFTWQDNWACVDYCGSQADNWLRKQGGATTYPSVDPATPISRPAPKPEPSLLDRLKGAGDWLNNNVLQPTGRVAKEAWERTATFGTYLWDWGRRNLRNPLQFLRDLGSGTVGWELLAAVVVSASGGRLRRHGPYCGREAECFVGGVAAQAATTIGHTITFRDTRFQDRLIAHEMQHVYDIESVGATAFYVSYAYNYVRDRADGMGHDEAYRNVYWERRAYYVEDGYDHSGTRPRGWPGHIFFEMGPVYDPHRCSAC